MYISKIQTKTETHTHTQTKTYLMSRCVVQKALPSHLWLLRYCFLSGEPDDRTTSSKGAAHDCKWTCPNDCPMLLQYIGRSYATTCSNKTHLQHHNFQGTCFFSKDGGQVPPPEASARTEAWTWFFGQSRWSLQNPNFSKQEDGFSIRTDGRSQGLVCIYLCLVELGDSFQTLLSLR